MSLDIISKYCTRIIITRGLFVFYPLFEVQKRFYKGLFSYNSGFIELMNITNSDI